MPTMGGRIKELREACGLKQADLSFALGLGQGTISNYENDRREPSIGELIRISAVFSEYIGDQLYYLVTGEKIENKMDVVLDSNYIERIDAISEVSEFISEMIDVKVIRLQGKTTPTEFAALLINKCFKVNGSNGNGNTPHLINLKDATS